MDRFSTRSRNLGYQARRQVLRPMSRARAQAQAPRPSCVYQLIPSHRVHQDQHYPSREDLNTAKRPRVPPNRHRDPWGLTLRGAAQHRSVALPVPLGGTSAGGVLSRAAGWLGALVAAPPSAEHIEPEAGGSGVDTITIVDKQRTAEPAPEPLPGDAVQARFRLESVILPSDTVFATASMD